MSSAFLNLLGAPVLQIDGVPVALRRKALALLCILATADRPCDRRWLATLLWGEGRLANLRQELAHLRRAASDPDWLVVDERHVRVRLPTDVAEARRDPSRRASLRRRGRPLEGLEVGATDALQLWLDDAVSQLDEAVEGAPAPGREDVLDQVLACVPVELASDDVVADWLDLPTWRVTHARSAVSLDPGAFPPEGLLPRIVAHALGGRRAPRLDPWVAAHPDAALRFRWWWPAALAGDRQAAERAAADAPPTQRVQALARAAELAVRALDLEAAAGHVDALERDAVRSQDPVALYEAAMAQGRRLAASGDLERSRASLEEADRLAARHLDAGARSRVRALAGQVLALSGDLQAALERLDGGCDADPTSRVVARITRGILLARQGRFDEALELHDEAVDLARELGDRDAAARALLNLGAAAERAGRLGRAARCFEHALVVARDLGDANLDLHGRLNLAEVRRRQGALGEARTLAAAAFDAPSVPPTLRAHALHLRGELELACGRGDEAVHWLLRAQDAWSSLGRPEAHNAGLMARLAAGEPWDAVLDQVDDLPLPTLRELVAWELAVRAPSLSCLERALAGRTTFDPLHVEALCRAHAPGPWSEALTAALRGDGPLPEALLRLAVVSDPPRAERALAEASQGLLASQAEALRTRWAQVPRGSRR